MTQAERITALEVEVAGLKSECASMNQKLDDLLALKNKGAGVFWLVSTLIGAGIIGAFVQVMEWIKG